MKTYGHFYGFEQAALKGGLFKIYVIEGALCGAKIAGAVYDEATARGTMVHFGLLGWALSKWVGKRAAAACDEQRDALAGLPFEPHGGHARSAGLRRRSRRSRW